MNELAKYAKQHYPPALAWPEGRMKAWLEWGASYGFVMAIMDEGKPIGMIFAKPVKRQPKEDNSFEFDRNGSYIHINLAVADSPAIQRLLALAVVKNIGLRPKVIYKSKDRWKIKDTRKVLRALFKVK